jgi:hypothetical protein
MNLCSFLVLVAGVTPLNTRVLAPNGSKKTCIGENNNTFVVASEPNYSYHTMPVHNPGGQGTSGSDEGQS